MTKQNDRVISFSKIEYAAGALLDIHLTTKRTFITLYNLQRTLILITEEIKHEFTL